MLIVPRSEDALIDSYGPRTDDTAPTVTQADDPGADLQSVGGASIPALPSPSVGGQNGSRIRNGFSTGFRGFRQRIAALTGIVVVAPPIRNPVQGDVGRTNRVASLYAGVRDQQVQYSAADPSLLAAQITGAK